MSFTRQLSEMSASELNDAIDDTNFPQAHILSRGRNNSVCSTSSTSGTSSLVDRAVNQPEDLATVPPAAATEEPVVNVRPRLILKSSNSIPENDGTQPITPMTPRTSTTPGSGILGMRRMHCCCCCCRHVSPHIESFNYCAWHRAGLMPNPILIALFNVPGTHRSMQ